MNFLYITHYYIYLHIYLLIYIQKIIHEFFYFSNRSNIRELTQNQNNTLIT